MIRLLLVDDHTMFREGLKQILAGYGEISVVAEARDGVEALEAVRAQELDVVVLDLSMPNRGGLETLADIRRSAPSLRVLVLSMHPENQYAIRVLRAGASGYLSKESAAEELVAAIRTVAGGRRFLTADVAERLVDELASPGSFDPHLQLSDREFQVFTLLASGCMLGEIGEQLGISDKTVTTYRARLLEKLGLRNNVELTKYAIERGLV